MGTSLCALAFIASPIFSAPPPADFVSATGRVLVTDATAPLPLVESFSELAAGEVPGVLVVPGARLGERCVGQTRVESPGGFERTSGAPSVPLTLAPAGPGDGLYVIAGCVVGLAGGLANDDIGEGALTILFDQPHRTIGLHLSETDPGAGLNRFECFASDGSLLDALVVPTGDRDLTFTSLAAPIRALTFNTTDELGAGIDNLRLRLPQEVRIESGAAPHPVAADFGALTDGEQPGLLAVPGAQLFEACVGQVVLELPTHFETTFGQPGSPPTPALPGAQDGLYAFAQSLTGLAQGTQQIDVGEGAITILYEQPQMSVGLRTIDTQLAPNGLIRCECFAADGSRIGVASALAHPDRELTIRSSSTPIAVLTITNTDPHGLRIDDLRHVVPGP